MRVLTIVLILFSSIFASQSPYIKDGYIYAPQECSYSCEELKDGYFSRVSNLNLEKGLITCSIYSVSNPLQVLETRTLFNKHCKDTYNYIPNKNHADLDTLTIDEQLKTLETKYFQNFSNTGQVKYLTAPEFLVAVLTADASIIDISETIDSNSIILKPDYTIYPNQSKEYEANFVQKIFDFFSDINPFSESENTIIPLDNYPSELKSSTSQLISTVGVFWLDFITEINFLYQETNLLLVMLISPFVFIVLMGEQFAQKLSKVHNHNNWVGAGVVSALVCLTMFVSYPVEEIDEVDFLGNEKKLEQSFYQDNASDLLANGVQIANTFNAGFNKVYINQMARNASVNPAMSQIERIDKLEHLELVHEAYSHYLSTCEQTYNMATLENVASKSFGMPLKYPPVESYGAINFYTHLKNPEDIIVSNLYSISSCYEVDRTRQLLSIQIQNLAKEIENAKNAIENGMEQRVLNIAEVAYKNTVEMGFLSALTTSSMNSMLANMEEWQHYSDDIDKKREYIEEETQKAMKSYSDVDASDFLENDLVAMFPKYIPYFAMPLFSNIYQGVGKMAGMSVDLSANYAERRLQKNSKADSKSLNKSLGMQKKEEKKSNGFLDMLASFVLKIAKLHPSFSVLEAMLKIGGEAIILAVSIWIYEYFLALLVPFAILSAGLLVVLFWLAEIVIYYLVVPFMFAHAMVKGQGQAITKFLARGLIISARPTLLVFSIIVAILLNSLYEAVSMFVITKNFSAIFGLNELGMIDTFAGLIQQGFYEIALKLFIPVIMFFIILLGSTLFLRQFGYQDEAEFGQQLSSSLDAKGGRYNLPI